MKIFFALAAAAFVFLQLVASTSSTALDDYVSEDDGHYSWEDSGLRIMGRNFDGAVSYTG